MARELVPEELWRRIEPILPKRSPRRRRGRPFLPDRQVLAGILFVLRSGIPWEMLPQEMGCGSGMTCWRRLAAWQRRGVWKKLHLLLLGELRAADRLDFSRAAVDSSSVRAVGGAKKPAQARWIGARRARSTTSLRMRRAFHSLLNSRPPTRTT